MGVVMKGGTSGNSQDYLAPTPNSGSPQPLLDTGMSGSEPSTVVLMGHMVSGHRENSNPSSMLPAGGTIPTGSTDIGQQDIAGLGPNSGDHRVFKTVPNTGNRPGEP